MSQQEQLKHLLGSINKEINSKKSNDLEDYGNQTHSDDEGDGTFPNQINDLLDFDQCDDEYDFYADLPKPIQDNDFVDEDLNNGFAPI